MISWSDIEAECCGFREGLVATFRKYEGMETDERDAANRVVKVTMASFARHMGVAEGTFNDWVSREMGRATRPTPRGSFNERFQKQVKEAAAEAQAKAEAKAQKALAAALKAQEEKAAAQAWTAAQNAQKQQKQAVVAERARVEAAAKVEARKEAEKKIKEIQAKLEQEFKAREFDPSHLTPSQRSEIMVLLANDPAEAKRWFKAYEDERKRKLSAANAKAVEANRKRLEQMQDRERRAAHQKASKEFEDSALKMFSSLADLARKCQKLLQTKPVTFNHLITSGLSANDWVKMTEDVEDVAVAFRESIFEANAAEELSEIK
jgi:hypothetical protein